MSKEREVLYVTATRIRFMCPMNFNKFPMDTQTCKFQVGKHNGKYGCVASFSAMIYKLFEGDFESSKIFDIHFNFNLLILLDL